MLFLQHICLVTLSWSNLCVAQIGTFQGLRDHVRECGLDREREECVLFLWENCVGDIEPGYTKNEFASPSLLKRATQRQVVGSLSMSN